jgi:hypothetical protein
MKGIGYVIRGIVVEPGDFGIPVPENPRFPMDVEGMVLEILLQFLEGVGQKYLFLGIHRPVSGGAVGKPERFVPGFPHLGQVPGIILHHPIHRIVFHFFGLRIITRIIGPQDIPVFVSALGTSLVARGIAYIPQGIGFSLGPFRDASFFHLLSRLQEEAEEYRRFRGRLRIIPRRVQIGTWAGDGPPLGFDFRIWGRIGG